MLHITNGDSTRIGLERSGLPGTFQPWRDVLYDGPAPARRPVEEFRRIRSAFIGASGAFGTAAEIERVYAQEDAAVAGWSDHDEMVLWFEHDLYDQLLLVRLLSMLPPDAGRKVSLISTDTYLGALDPDQFPPLFEQRRPLTAEQLALGARAWDAFGADTPRPLLEALGNDTSALPYLRAALVRLLEEYPSDRDGLGRSERQILEAIDQGARTGNEAFTACAGMEAAIFMGDSTFWSIAERLARGAVPLITIGAAMRDPVALTSAGRDVLGGRADYVALNGIDRWLGGVRLTPASLWRRTSEGVLRRAS
jgi:hypothetical protein